MPQVPDRIAIVLMSALGDVTLGLPVATALRRARPDVRLTWVAQRGPSFLVEGHPAIDAVIPFDRRGGWRSYRDVRRALRDAGPFDAVLDLQVAIKAGLVTWLAPAREKWGVDRELAPQPRRHMADQFLEFLAPFGVNAEPITYGLEPLARRAEPVAWRRALLGDGAPYAVLVLASSAAHKNWFADRWIAVADALGRDHGVRVVLAGGDTPYERETAAAIAAATTTPVVNALGSGIPNLLALLDTAALVIAPDTGPMHLGIALGRPVIALMGSTNPKWVGPHRLCHDLLVDRYGDPGEDYPVTAARREGRMALVTVEDVLEKLMVWRERYAGETAADGGR
jgi:heptosyltransferase I